MKELTRTEILSGQYIYPKGLVSLVPTRHFFDRVQQRDSGVQFLPKTARVTRDNVHSGKTWDGRKVESIVIKEDYLDKFIFICYNPFDGAIKSMWIKPKKNARR